MLFAVAELLAIIASVFIQNGTQQNLATCSEVSQFLKCTSKMWRFHHIKTVGQKNCLFFGWFYDKM